MDAYTILKYISKSSILIAIISGVISYKQQQSTFKKFFYFLFFALFIEIFSDIFGRIYHNTNPIRHVYTTIECLVYLWMYYSMFYAHFKFRNLILTFSGLALFFEIVNVLSDGFWERNDLSRGINAGILISCAITYFYFKIKHFNGKSLFADPEFWFVTSTLIYFGFGLFYFSMYSILTKINIEYGNYLGEFHFFINFANNVLIAYSFYLFNKK